MKVHLRRGLQLLLLVGLMDTINAADPAPDRRRLAVNDYYSFWKREYLVASKRFPGDYKVNYDARGATVSEAIGYGMLITVLMADSDPRAREFFDGLDRFRRRFPSRINPAFMCWKVPPNEKTVKDDCATDGEIDMAYALLLAHQRWGESYYLSEAKGLITNIASSLVRPDGSLRLGDWNQKQGQTRPSDFIPTHFRAFGAVTGDPIWQKVEIRCYTILGELQKSSSPKTGLIPDFSIQKKGTWVPAKPGFLEGGNDGRYYYNACRVPWRIGWAATALHDDRAIRFLGPFMEWTAAVVKSPEKFRAGYRLDGTPVHKSDFDTACFISPTGVAAMALKKKGWENTVFAYGVKKREEYYSDTVNLLCLILMSGIDGRLKSLQR